MFDPIYTKDVYFFRVLYSGGLIITCLVSVEWYRRDPVVDEVKISLIIAAVSVALMAFLALRLINELIEWVTGLIFFHGIFSFFLLFAVALFLSIYIASLYFIFNLVQLLRCRTDE